MFKQRTVPARLMTTFIAVSVIAIMIITSTIAAVSYLRISSLSTINLQSVRKNQELKQLDNLIGKVRELHSNVRDYVLTRDSDYITDVAGDKASILALASQFSDSLRSDHKKSNMLLLNDLIARKLEYNEKILKLYQYGGRDIALEFIETGKASVLNDSIELIANNIKEIENVELETTVNTYNKAAHRTRLTIIFATVLIILLGLVFMLTTIRNLQQRATIISELEKAKDDSEKAAQLKGQFMSNMSHEIRTPLNSIVGFTNLLTDTKLSERQADFVRTIRSASENLLAIVNDILDFSKIEAGMMKRNMYEFSIDEVFGHLRKLLEPGAKQNNLELHFNGELSVPAKCVGDFVRLNQILVNLIGNAIKFTERGSVTILVKAIEVLEEKVVLEFRVRDTGIGIPADKLATIFDRFEQVNTNVFRKTQGTGLGLSIARSLVEMEGGTISVSSIEGSGTEFVFTVHYKLPAENAVTSATVTKGLSKAPDPNIKLTGRVLLVEDNPMNQKLTGLIFEKWGIKYDIAPDGATACTMLRDVDYALVLMDIQLPDMDGYQATDIIRKEMKLTLPIVALTAHAYEGEADKFTGISMNGYITKPFKEEELYGVLFNFLKVEKKPKKNSSDMLGYSPVIDFTEVEKISGGSGLFVKELADIFRSQIQTELSSLDTAYQQRDMKTLTRTAHSMKSTIAYMGLMERLEHYLTRIEKATDSDWANGDLYQDIYHVNLICMSAVRQIEAESYVSQG